MEHRISSFHRRLTWLFGEEETFQDIHILICRNQRQGFGRQLWKVLMWKAEVDLVNGSYLTAKTKSQQLGKVSVDRRPLPVNCTGEVVFMWRNHHWLGKCPFL